MNTPKKYVLTLAGLESEEEATHRYGDISSSTRFYVAEDVQAAFTRVLAAAERIDCEAEEIETEAGIGLFVLMEHWDAFEEALKAIVEEKRHAL